ncbi:unnamed protein product, partial [Phaeothamnion confervicola]
VLLRHPLEVLAVRLDLLRRIPETVDPATYAHLLPCVAPSSGASETGGGTGIAGGGGGPAGAPPYYCLGARSGAPELAAGLGGGGGDGGSTGFNGDHPALPGLEPEGAAPSAAAAGGAVATHDTEALLAKTRQVALSQSDPGVLARWYYERCLEMDALGGQVKHALDMCRLGLARIGVADERSAAMAVSGFGHGGNGGGNGDASAGDVHGSGGGGGNKAVKGKRHKSFEAGKSQGAAAGRAGEGWEWDDLDEHEDNGDKNDDASHEFEKPSEASPLTDARAAAIAAAAVAGGQSSSDMLQTVAAASDGGWPARLRRLYRLLWHLETLLYAGALPPLTTAAGWIAAGRSGRLLAVLERSTVETVVEDVRSRALSMLRGDRAIPEEEEDGGHGGTGGTEQDDSWAEELLADFLLQKVERTPTAEAMELCAAVAVASRPFVVQPELRLLRDDARLMRLVLGACYAWRDNPLPPRALEAAWQMFECLPERLPTAAAAAEVDGGIRGGGDGGGSGGGGGDGSGGGRNGGGGWAGQQ